MKNIFNKKGYTLTYAIIVIGLLLILTASVTFVSYYNFKVSKIGGHVNTSFYANDGALEEALTELSISTYNAEVTAWNRVTDLKALMSNSEWELFLNAIYEDVNNKLFDIDMGNELIAFALKGEFEATFYNELYNGVHASHPFFDTNASGLFKYHDYDVNTSQFDYNLTVTPVTEISPSIRGELLKVSLLDLDGSNPKYLTEIVTADVDPVISVSNITLESDGSFRLTIGSDGTYHNYNKKIAVDVTVKAPEYTFSVAMLQENIALARNKSTDKTLIANGDIVFVNGTTVVDGDIYAYGDGININYDLDRNKYGGIVVGYESVGETAYKSTTLGTLSYGTSAATATVNGDVATRNSIKMETTGSTFNVNKIVPSNVGDPVKGNIFANSLHVRKSSSKSNINIGNDLYLYADLYIGGKNAKIEVGTEKPSFVSATDRNLYRPQFGGIYGLHSDNFATESEYTRTGSIIISKDAIDNTDPDNVIYPSIKANGIYLFGVMRFDAYETGVLGPTGKKVAYQSGESMTTYQNSQYYQSLLSTNIYQKGVFSTLKSFTDANDTNKFYDMIHFGLEGYDLDQVGYRSNHFYTMGYYAFTDTADIYKKIDVRDKNIINLRDTKVNGSNEYFAVATTGILAFNNKVVNNTKTKVTSELDILSKQILGSYENVDEKVNMLGYTERLGELGSYTYSEHALFNDWFDTTGGGVPLINEQSPDVSLYNTEAAKDIFINMTGPSDAINILGLSRDEESFSGTIVSKGDIYIYAGAGETVSFTGNIISEKNIYFIGPGAKNIIYDELTIYKAINDAQVKSGAKLERTDNLKTFYDTTNGKTISTTLNTKDAGFKVNMLPYNLDADKIRLNYVSDALTDGTNITNSNSIIIDSWTETD